MMQRRLKNHVIRRHENIASLEFYWERAVEELNQLATKNSELKKIIDTATQHPHYE